MAILDSLPSPDDVAKQIQIARKQRELLQRLYRLVLEAKQQSTQEIHSTASRPNASTKEDRHVQR